MRRIWAKATCPYWRRVHNNVIVCDGPEHNMTIRHCFGTQAQRDEYVTQYCSGYISGARCPLARLLDEKFQK